MESEIAPLSPHSCAESRQHGWKHSAMYSCVCARPLQTASHHLGEGRDKQSVWAEIRWEQTLGRLTVSESLQGELCLYGLSGPEDSF